VDGAVASFPDGVIVESISRRVTAAALYRAMRTLQIPPLALGLGKFRHPIKVDEVVREVLRPDAGHFVFLEELAAEGLAAAAAATRGSSTRSALQQQQLIYHQQQMAAGATSTPFAHLADPYRPVLERLPAALACATQPIHTTQGSRQVLEAGVSRTDPGVAGGGVSSSGKQKLPYVARFPTSHQLYYIPEDGVPIAVGRHRQPPATYFSVGGKDKEDKRLPNKVIAALPPKTLPVLKAWFGRHWVQQAAFIASGGAHAGVDQESRDWLTKHQNVPTASVITWIRSERKAWADELLATCSAEPVPLLPVLVPPPMPSAAASRASASNRGASLYAAMAASGGGAGYEEPFAKAGAADGGAGAASGLVGALGASSEPPAKRLRLGDGDVSEAGAVADLGAGTAVAAAADGSSRVGGGGSAEASAAGLTGAELLAASVASAAEAGGVAGAVAAYSHHPAYGTAVLESSTDFVAADATAGAGAGTGVSAGVITKMLYPAGKQRLLLPLPPPSVPTTSSLPKASSAASVAVTGTVSTKGSSVAGEPTALPLPRPFASAPSATPQQFTLGEGGWLHCLPGGSAGSAAAEEKSTAVASTGSGGSAAPAASADMAASADAAAFAAYLGLPVEELQRLWREARVADAEAAATSADMGGATGAIAKSGMEVDVGGALEAGLGAPQQFTLYTFAAAGAASLQRGWSGGDACRLGDAIALTVTL
jgi:hypothetical protein